MLLTKPRNEKPANWGFMAKCPKKCQLFEALSPDGRLADFFGMPHQLAGNATQANYYLGCHKGAIRKVGSCN